MSRGPISVSGVAALQTDKLDDAEIAFRVAYRLDPKCAKACAGLAMVAQQRRDLSRAFDFYMKSLELDTDNILALLGLFQVSCDMGSFAKVIYYLEVYLQMHPGDASVMFASGRPVPAGWPTRARQGDPAKAPDARTRQPRRRQLAGRSRTCTRGDEMSEP